MQLTIKECNMLISGLAKLAEIKMKTPIRFDIVRNMKNINSVLESAVEANDGNSMFDDEMLKKEVEVETYLFEMQDFDNLDIEPMSLYEISKLIKDL